MRHIDEIIQRLGYSESNYLKRKSDGYDTSTLTSRASKVLNELSPHAAYVKVDGEPFVLFFDSPTNQDDFEILSRKIWNAQIPVAIICSSTTVKIFNGYTIDDKKFTLTEVMQLSVEAIDGSSPFALWEIANPDFWTKHASHFSGKRLNDSLLENLTYLSKRLKTVHNAKSPTRFVLRLIFVRYLIDRGINLDFPGFSSNASTSRGTLLTLLEDSTSLYALFAHLKEKFNGNLFEMTEKDEELTGDALSEVKDFLSADIQANSRQLSLVHLYDFNLIPVELISSIYEILLGEETQAKYNAFYTPQYLVDYILDGTIKEYISEKGTCRILDPSCGSGIFLVNSYRWMVERKLGKELYAEDDELLRKTLTENIFGVDLSEEAVDVAIFSLYLAMLDYKNPKNLEGFFLPELKNKNLIVSDFFDEGKLAALQRKQFDFIIGNPPWGSKHGMHIEYCNNHEYKSFMKNNDTCRCFILRSKDFCNENTQCCFVLRSTMFYVKNEQTKNFRDYLLTHTDILRVIELSSVRKLIFQDATAPAIVLSYKFSKRETLENRFEHIAMKPNIFFRLFNIIVVEKTDIKSVSQRFLVENDWAWKSLMYGLTGDIDNILALKRDYITMGQAISEQRPEMLLGAGVQYHKGDAKDARHLQGRDFLPSNAIDHFAVNLTNLVKFEKSEVHRPRDVQLFHAPYCLLLKGINTTDYTMRASFCNISFVFNEAIYAIKGNEEQKAFLKNLTGLLNSTFYAYCNLLMGSSLGVEREQRFIGEILDFPYAFSEDIVALVEQIQDAKNNVDIFVVADDAVDKVNALNQAISKTFGLGDNDFVDYALRIQIPSLTRKNDSDATRNVHGDDLIVYAKCFHDYLSEIFAHTNKYVLMRLHLSVAKYFSAIEVVILDSQPPNWVERIDAETDAQKSILIKLSSYKINEVFYCQKDILYFEEASFCIIKSNRYKNWHPAIARLDLMEVADQILSKDSTEES
jgi:predicted RNA methylase